MSHQHIAACGTCSYDSICFIRAVSNIICIVIFTGILNHIKITSFVRLASQVNIMEDLWTAERLADGRRPLFHT